MFKYLPFILLLFVINGCVGVAFEGAHITKDEFKRRENMPAAEKGDKVAQFKVGEAYCCSTDDSGAAYDTTLALHWLCASAKQGYGPAMYKIGKIYSGDVIDGIRLLRRATTGLVESMEGNTVSLSVAYAWLHQADMYGIEDANDRMQKVRKSMKLTDMQRAQRMIARGLEIPCEFNEVFEIKK